ncbi:uncharacterized protein [Malus domestica]|uniref:uncharacterized protein n=1 Tax=Malus domestica TaxID=3750 RepID=UPI00397620AE
MTNLTKLDFAALDIIGKNYLTLVLDTKIHLEAGNLRDTIREENNSSSQDRGKAMIFIHRHLDEGLKSEYLTVEDLITSQMKLCGDTRPGIRVKLPGLGDTITEENMLEKTFSTFHVSNVFLQQQYRARGFTEYNQLISVLLVAEQNNELLMKNHQSQPTGSAPFPEVNDASLEVNATSSGGDNHKRGRGHKRGRWNRKGKNHGGQSHNQVPRKNSGPSFKNGNRHKGKARMNNALRNFDGACHRCGGDGHWVHTYPKTSGGFISSLL